MLCGVFLFFFSIVTSSFVLSFPLLAINNSMWTCFTTLLLCSLVCWLFCDSLANQKDFVDNRGLRETVRGLKNQLEVASFENKLAQRELAFLKTKYYTICEERERLLRRAALFGSGSCSF